MSVTALPPPPVRVVLACESLAVRGGVERFVCHLADALAKGGAEAVLASADPPGTVPAYRLWSAVRVLCAGRADRRSEGGWRPWQLLRTQWQVGRAIGRAEREVRPQVIVLNGLVLACAVLALHPGLARRAICCDHNHFAARSLFWRGLRRLLYPRVAAVVCLSEADAPRFAALNARTQVIANASALVAEQPADVAAPIVLAVGRHQAQKGFDLLLAAWADVVRAVPAARLMIVGAGPLSSELRRLADGLGLTASVDWIAPTLDIEAHYRSAALFVLSSRYEGMPLALLEAQALGVPVVAFDCPTGPREIIGAETGVLVAPADTVALAAAIVALLRDPARRARMGRAAIARRREHFSMTAHVDAWRTLIGAVAAETDRLPA